MLYLCTIILFSHRLTPQQNEAEVVKSYPPGYKHDRTRACIFATEMYSKLEETGLVPEGVSTQLFSQMEQSLCVDRNRQQRDLPEQGLDDKGPFFHDNEHEYRVTLQPDATWVGPRPRIPDTIPCNQNYSDPNLPDYYSEGEEFLECDWSEQEKDERRGEQRGALNLLEKLQGGDEVLSEKEVQVLDMEMDTE